MGLDVLISGAILAAAIFYIVRSVTRQSHHCSCGKEGACHAARPKDLVD